MGVIPTQPYDVCTVNSRCERLSKLAKKVVVIKVEIGVKDEKLSWIIIDYHQPCVFNLPPENPYYEIS